MSLRRGCVGANDLISTFTTFRGSFLTSNGRKNDFEFYFWSFVASERCGCELSRSHWRFVDVFLVFLGKSDVDGKQNKSMRRWRSIWRLGNVEKRVEVCRNFVDKLRGNWACLLAFGLKRRSYGDSRGSVFVDCLFWSRRTQGNLEFHWVETFTLLKNIVQRPENFTRIPEKFQWFHKQNSINSRFPLFIFLPMSFQQTFICVNLTKTAV
jgi:hypothetical protein